MSSGGGDSLVIVQPAEERVQATAGGGAVVLTPATHAVLAQTPAPVIVETAPAPITAPAGDAATVVVQTATRELVQAGGGLQGPAGPPGPGGNVTTVFVQAVPSATWTVTHNLNRYPSVTVIDSAGTQVFGNLRYVSPAQLILTFSVPFAGTAYLN